MKRFPTSLLAALFVTRVFAQPADIPQASIFYNLAPGDSVTVYQCRVVPDTNGPRLAADTPDPAYTLSDKVVIRRYADSVVATVYSTHIRDFPNRKFSGLKIRERPYWLFRPERRVTVSPQLLSNLFRLERAGREAMEYDYPVTRYTTNQVIIKRGKDFRQLVYEVPISVTALLEPVRQSSDHE